MFKKEGKPSDNIKKPEDKESAFSAFKSKEKKYKYFVDKKTDFSELIDLRNPLDHSIGIEEFKVKNPRTGKEVRGFKFPKPSGLIILKDYTSKELQLTMCRNSLNIYHRHPHRTNLYIYDTTSSKEPPKDSDQPEESFKQNTTEEGCMMPDKPQTLDPKDQQEHLGKRENSNETEQTQGIVKIEESKPKDYNKDHFLVEDNNRYYFNTKIRWSNIGKQYNWDKRDYLVTESTMPKELDQMANDVVSELGMGSYCPEALIINYYGWRNVMGGHLDDGEPDQEHPIVSFSFGLSCVFLIGGKTKEVEPLAVRLDSGDVMVMSEESRRCFHGRLGDENRSAEDTRGIKRLN